jgi:type VI secretion system protein ImpB
MAGESFQNEIPPARVNIRFTKEVGGAKEKIELPMKMLLVGDYTQREADAADNLATRKRINVNKDNFESVMKEMKLGVRLNVPNRLSGQAGDEMTVNLKFDSMKSFHPEEVAKQVPELNALLAARMLLKDLRARLISGRELRKELEKIVKDPELLEKTLKDLDAIAPLPPSLEGGSEAKPSG